VVWQKQWRALLSKNNSMNLYLLFGAAFIVQVIIWAIIIRLATFTWYDIRGFGQLPFVPSLRSRVEGMIALAGTIAGQKVVDIGSGDGRIVIAAAQAGAEAHGFEINKYLVATSRFRIRRRNLEHTAFIHSGDLWQQDFSSFDVVFLYGIPGIMDRLESKLKSELRPGTRIVTNGCEFPTLLSQKADGSIRVYTV
jgi:ribosomal protein L11 methylase PrmA